VKKIYPNEDYCVDCHLCKVACVTAHSKSKDVVKAHKVEKDRVSPRLRVEERYPSSVAVQCRHCDDPLCVRACISGAMTKDPDTGIVSNDLDRCVGCWSCIVACPNSAIMRFELEGRKVALKCDMCRGQDAPACVLICPNRALVLSERAGEAK
jgi:carbon-monoxide dehydrogenase iron sulfur subunit